MSARGHVATAWCEREEHARCHGSLLAETGWHWYCACPCHPTPRRNYVYDNCAALEQLEIDRVAFRQLFPAAGRSAVGES
ncbi:MAG TPA: hypothetical protein VIJ31_10575 [Acidothermaceae bacterium]